MSLGTNLMSLQFASFSRPSPVCSNTGFHQKNHYPADKYYRNQLHYPMDRGSSSGYLNQAFEQLGPDLLSENFLDP